MAAIHPVVVHATAAIDAAQRVPGCYVLQRHKVHSPTALLPLRARCPLVLCRGPSREILALSHAGKCVSAGHCENLMTTLPLRDIDGDCERSHTLCHRLITSRATNTPSRCSDGSSLTKPSGSLSYRHCGGGVIHCGSPSATPLHVQYLSTFGRLR